MQAEFVEGVARYLAGISGAERRRLLEEIKADPTTDKLKRFWTLKQRSNQDLPDKDDQGH